jgi:hypothetical protein
MKKNKINRWVALGDVVIRKKKDGEGPWVGVVYDVAENHASWGRVLLHWTPDAPPHYDSRYGLSRVNVHNCYNVYDVVNKKGVLHDGKA